MKRKNKNKKKNNNANDNANDNVYATEDFQELTRKDGMKKNQRRRNRHNQKRDLKYYYG